MEKTDPLEEERIEITPDIANIRYLVNELIPAELNGDRVYEIRYDADRLMDYKIRSDLSEGLSPEEVLQEYVTLLRIRSKKTG